jgi:hypothetical protein
MTQLSSELYLVVCFSHLACQALSDFADYVEQQQSFRYPASHPATKEKSAEDAQHHEELDELFDNLDLDDSAPQVPLKELLLSSDEDSLKKLEDVISDRITEGFGETVFEVGFENNGDSMQLTPEEWDQAYKKLVEGAKRIRADCELLITKNVGGDKEAASTTAKPSKDKSCSGKILIRQVPSKTEDVIETRIAVVGNGKPPASVLRLIAV